MAYRNPGYSDKVVKAVGRDYCDHAVQLHDICRTHRVSVTTIYAWRRRYGWPKRPKWGIDQRRRRGEELRYWLDSEPRKWRCDCGRVNLEPRCPCGVVPAWAA